MNMQRIALPHSINKILIGFLIMIYVAQMLSLDVFAVSEVAKVNLEDGDYTIEVMLEGGSGRATITSPAAMIVRNGEAYARIQWSSSNYDYMKMDDKIFTPVSQDGSSTFEIPIPDFDKPITVAANTTAMSTPHEIEYTVTFLQNSIKQNASDGMTVAIAGSVIVIAAAVIVTFSQIYRKRRKQGK